MNFQYMIDRQRVQLLADQLDRNVCTLADAKRFVRENYGVESKARTKDAFIRELGAIAKSNAQPIQPENLTTHGHGRPAPRKPS